MDQRASALKVAAAAAVVVLLLVVAVSVAAAVNRPDRPGRNAITVSTSDEMPPLRTTTTVPTSTSTAPSTSLAPPLTTTTAADESTTTIEPGVMPDCFPAGTQIATAEQLNVTITFDETSVVEGEAAAYTMVIENPSDVAIGIDEPDGWAMFADGFLLEAPDEEHYPLEFVPSGAFSDGHIGWPCVGETLRLPAHARRQVRELIDTTALTPGLNHIYLANQSHMIPSDWHWGGPGGTLMILERPPLADGESAVIQ